MYILNCYTQLQIPKLPRVMNLQKLCICLMQEKIYSAYSVRFSAIFLPGSVCRSVNIFKLRSFLITICAVKINTIFIYCCEVSAQVYPAIVRVTGSILPFHEEL